MSESSHSDNSAAMIPAEPANAVEDAPRSARGLTRSLRKRVLPLASLGLAGAVVGAGLVGAPRGEAVVAVPAAQRTANAVTQSSELATTQLAATAAASVAEWKASLPKNAGTRFALGNLALRSDASSGAAKVATVSRGSKVTITDRVKNGYRFVTAGSRSGWLLNARLGTSAPKAPQAARAMAASADVTPTRKKAQARPVAKQAAYTGRSVLGLKPRAMVVYNAVTARWSFSSIGGYRANNNRSNHGQGGAIDFMTFKDSAKGWAVARYVAANAAAFKIDHIIFEQKIWTPSQPVWRPMADRGSVTANHYDHVHVSVKL